MQNPSKIRVRVNTTSLIVYVILLRNLKEL